MCTRYTRSSRGRSRTAVAQIRVAFDFASSSPRRRCGCRRVRYCAQQYTGDGNRPDRSRERIAHSATNNPPTAERAQPQSVIAPFMPGQGRDENKMRSKEREQAREDTLAGGEILHTNSSFGGGDGGGVLETLFEIVQSKSLHKSRSPIHRLPVDQQSSSASAPQRSSLGI